MQNNISSKISVLEERTKNIDEKVDSLTETVEKNFMELKKDMKSYVRQEEFTPVKTVVYALVGMILTAVVTSIIALVI